MRRSVWILVVAAFASSAAAADHRAGGVLAVRVRPEIKLTVDGVRLHLKIRLASGAVATLWRDTTCGSTPNFAHRVSRSGVWNIGMGQLPGEGVKVCVSSSDGVLRAEQSVR